MATSRSWIEVKPAVELKRPPEAYKNESDPRGPIFISNCNKFIHDSHEERLGSENDVRNLDELFTQIGYKSTVVRDLTKQQLLDALKNFRENNGQLRVDSLVAVFMSHGHENVFVASDDQEIHVDEVFDIFNSINCPNLEGKPKLFIFQFCRRKRQNNENSIQSNVDSAAMGTGSLGHPEITLSDSHVCFSTLPDNVAYRNTEEGALFIRNLCCILMDCAKDANMADLMLKVNTRLRKEPQKQLCEYRMLGCQRKFFFNPKGNQSDDAVSHALTSNHYIGYMLKVTCAMAMTMSLGLTVWVKFHRLQQIVVDFWNSWVGASITRPPDGSSVAPSMMSIAGLASGSGFQSGGVASGSVVAGLQSAAAIGAGLHTQYSRAVIFGTLGIMSASVSVLGHLFHWANISMQPYGMEENSCDMHYPNGHGKRVTILINTLRRCDKDVLSLFAVFENLGDKVVIIRNTNSISSLMDSLRQFESKFYGPVVVIFFGYGFSDYLFPSLSDEEILSFKVFCEIFSSVRKDGYPTVVFTNTIFKAPSSQTIVHQGPEKPAQDTFHFCTKVGGRCQNGSLLTRALLQEINRNPRRDFASFAHDLATKIEELEAEDDDQYYTDIRFYGVTRKCFFPNSKVER